jgi:hypothetical protein
MHAKIRSILIPAHQQTGHEQLLCGLLVVHTWPIHVAVDYKHGGFHRGTWTRSGLSKGRNQQQQKQTTAQTVRLLQIQLCSRSGVHTS